MGDTYDTAAEAAADRERQPGLLGPSSGIQQQPHCIEVEVTRYGAKGPVYRVSYAGKILIKACRCPLFESCRALVAQGITGRLELWRPGKATFDAACDVQVGAQYTIIENETESLRLARWFLSPWNAVSRRSVEAQTGAEASWAPSLTPEQTPILDAEPLPEAEPAK